MSKELKKWMPMFWPEYLADTGHLDTEQHGAYMLLIAHYWMNEGIPFDDDYQLMQITRLTRHKLKKFRPLLEKFFPNGRQKRIDYELARAVEKSKKMSANAMQRHSKSTSIGTAEAGTPTPTPTKKERKTPAAKEPPEFNDFWMSVPKREGSNPRIPALKSYQKAIRDGADPAQINAAAKRWARESLKTEPKFVAMAVTWLNQKRFEDYHVKPEAESNVVFDEATKLWEFREGYEPTDEEREAHAKYRRTAIATRFP